MEQNVQVPGQTPAFSLIVAVYNDWAVLEGCLQSLTRQSSAPSFEVIIVDDGSTETTPEFVINPVYKYPLILIRQSHAGIAAARNRGISVSKGAVLLFVDSDGRLATDCLTALTATISNAPQHDYFQLRLVGNCSSLVGRAEELRLVVFQKHALRPDGRIRYLNTAGFAIRRTRADARAEVFDPEALRGEDTLLLANLLQAGILPLFVPEAIVEHFIPLSLLQCLRKDVRSASLEGKTYGTIASKGVRVRVTQAERLKLMFSAWETAGRPSIGRSAWCVLALRQTLKRVLTWAYQHLG